ncbi:hypothetical protein SAMN04488515_1471 [Cognatiyoonia koreensis]|uniref:N-acetyltransferase domain-containing protein n=1 Tax=Cognatiyoonia koreensis TaxID=364200 RepID=A0A1I0PVP5_9RHOB|nr:hypothetical protein [Cognatiyoonia koreensis]SEW18556.1 hypothetical protein SAMN04488515_1471 [Cognatiyoonia koreensis]
MTTETLKTDDGQLTIWFDGPAWGDHAKVATVGKCKFPSAKAGTRLLHQAAGKAISAGATGLIGPMEGDTWHSYRLVSDQGTTKPFMMEPTSGPHDQQAFADAGFNIISSYFSASVPMSELPGARPHDTDAFTIETWDGTDPDGLFTQVHDLSCQAFANNPFYKHISLEDFLAMYRPVVPLLKQDLILFARNADGMLTGFLFGIPNYADGLNPKSVILKTYASVQKGAGHWLSYQFYVNAKAMGFDTAIHALMHDDNLSAIRSGLNGADVFRRYALMGKTL